MLDWLRRLRHPRALPPIPEAAWQATLARYAFLAERPAADVERLRALTAQFLRDKQFHGAQGFVITDEVALAIATQAVLPVLHLRGGLAWYDDFVGIVVHPPRWSPSARWSTRPRWCTNTRKSWPARPWTTVR